LAAVIEDTLRLRLSFRRPLSPDNLFGHLAATAVPGVEEVRDGEYRRTLRLPLGTGIIALSPQADHISCRVKLTDLGDLPAATARCRWLLDLDADPQAIDEQLSRDPVLESAIRRAPGRRVPRTVDGAEMAIRAVLGQQISTAAARTHAAGLAARHGEAVSDPDGGLTRLFPTPEALLEAEFKLPRARRDSLHGLLRALSGGQLDLSPGSDRRQALSILERLPGVGPWTREIIAMRALGDPDAFPVTDLGVRRGAQAIGLSATPGALLARAEQWRPWRAYATQHLWGAVVHPINRWPPQG
jgi:AraC family transcriptional regulator of adaptative response / DNA-3-methyladenine glycosylase II